MKMDEVGIETCRESLVSFIAIQIRRGLSDSPIDMCVRTHINYCATRTHRNICELIRLMFECADGGTADESASVELSPQFHHRWTNASNGLSRAVIVNTTVRILTK